ncbi:MAG TPA: HAMP domain-containing sensor histidine kinase [Ilumatobacteraceae bacterium]|nr:HAMP domain-containing sensor histidine kinase [Ilumatobacteraceae bacterium]
MRRPPLRWLMLIPTLVTITLGFGAFAVYIDSVERANLLADIDDELVRAERRSETLAPGDADGAPAEETATARDGDDVSPPVQIRLSPDGEAIGPGNAGTFSEETLRELSFRSGTVTVADPRYRVLVTPAEDGTVAVTALSLDRFDESVADFRQTLLVGGIVILLLVAGVIWLLTTLAVRPVTRMVTSATRIADGELETDVDPPSGSRETADLAEALDLMLDRLRTTINDSERAARSAEEARDAMRRFLADVSHELRTPLTALKGYSDLYAGGMLDEPGALDRAMSRIGDESERLNTLVTDMLQLARETPPTELTEPFDTAQVVEVVVADLCAAHPSVDVGLDVAPGTHTTVTGQQARFHQAMLNLGTNACRHTAPGTPVRFMITSTDTELTIQVIDHGRGVDPGEAEKIFLPFYRAETARERDGGSGAGLGLAIASQIVERHVGAITVQSTPGGGATFAVTVPLADA